MIAGTPQAAVKNAKERLLALAQSHSCYSHPLFEVLARTQLTVYKSACLLRNYDAHASLLRRLLLKAATIMPEAAVGYVLENVRNEYGNGDYSNNHQWQLQDVAWSAGVTRDVWDSVLIEDGVKRSIAQAGGYYFPRGNRPDRKLPGAVAAGAITATELLAIREFQFMHTAFSKLGVGSHCWFNHVLIEEEHSDESLSLALFFIEHYDAFDSVEWGMKGILDANVDLYDGLLAAVSR